MLQFLTRRQGKLSESVIKERLATSVNRVPVYEKKGEFQTDSKELLVIKTRESHLEALTEHVKANHEYDLFSDFQRPSKIQKGLKNVWCVKEDVALMSSWLFVIEDNKRGKSQKGVSLWARVHKLYHEKQKENPNELNERNFESMKGRCKRLSNNGNKWVAACKKAAARKRSGMSHIDVEREAHSIYEAGGSKFQDFVVFNEVMSKHPKWDLTSLHDTTHLCPENEEGGDQESGGSSKRPRKDREHFIPSSPDDSTTRCSTVSRPIGGDKVTKRGKGKVSQYDFVNEFARERRALKVSRDNETELMRNLSTARINLEREKLQMANLKVKEKMLNTLLAKDHLSREDEDLKRLLMTIVFKQ